MCSEVLIEGISGVTWSHDRIGGVRVGDAGVLSSPFNEMVRRVPSGLLRFCPWLVPFDRGYKVFLGYAGAIIVGA